MQYHLVFEDAAPNRAVFIVKAVSAASCLASFELPMVMRKVELPYCLTCAAEECPGQFIPCSDTESARRRLVPATHLLNMFLVFCSFMSIIQFILTKVTTY